MCCKVFKGFWWALRGIWQCIREEWHFRFHLVIAFYVVLLTPYFSLTRGEGAVLVLTLSAVLAAELFNSAVERAVDRISPERHPLAAAAKDMAAGAVLVTAIASVAVAILLYGKPEVWQQIFADFGEHIYKPILLAVSAVLAVLFIVKRRAS